MMTGRYYAAWVSDEKGGDSSHPNVLGFYANSDDEANAVATAFDALISGDLMSVTKVIDAGGSFGRPPYGVDGTGITDSGQFVVLNDAGEITDSQHFKFWDCKVGDSPSSALIGAYGVGETDHGKLLTFEGLNAIDAKKGARA